MVDFSTVVPHICIISVKVGGSLAFFLLSTIQLSALSFIMFTRTSICFSLCIYMFLLEVKLETGTWDLMNHAGNLLSFFSLKLLHIPL